MKTHRPVPEGGTPVNVMQWADPLQTAKDSPAFADGLKVGESGGIGLNPFKPGTDNHEFWKLGCCAGYTS